MFKPTTQQQNIIDLAKQGKSLAVKAFAGAAKTSTCIMVAKELPTSSLYVCFNKSIATEATTKFPSHVVCRTMHSIAYGVIICRSSNMRKKVNGYFKDADLDQYSKMYPNYDEEMWGDIKGFVISIISKFTQSAHMDHNGFYDEYVNELASNEDEPSPYITAGKPLFQLYWADIINQNKPTVFTHDTYLKLYQLTKPVLNYEVIYLDEAQDSNPCTLDIVLRQRHAQIILVGDPHQAIYEWRGAVNAFGNLPKRFVEAHLSESFRFTQSIADMATTIIAVNGNTIPVIGRASEVDTTGKEPNAILVRNNSTMIGYLLDAYKQDKKVYCVTDLTQVWGKLHHIMSLMCKKQPKFPDKDLREFRTFEALKKKAEKDAELSKLIKLTDLLNSGDGLYANIDSIKSVLVKEEDQDTADFVLSTGHKSKGLEWDVIKVDDDFLPKTRENQSFKDMLVEFQQTQGINLLYVSLTRAKYYVVMSRTMKDLLTDITTYIQRGEDDEEYTYTYSPTDDADYE